jgi:hypothetical protein
MKNKTILRLLAAFLLCAGMIACDRDKEDAANQIDDASGVLSTMSWSLTDGSDPQAIDIDMFLYKGVGVNKETTPTMWSDNIGEFEDLTLLNSLADGDYTLAADYLDLLDKSGSLNVIFHGVTLNKEFHINSVSFLNAEEGTEKDVAKINKAGSKFTISKL